MLQWTCICYLDFYCSTFLLLIKRCLRLAGGSSISQLVADHMSFSEAKWGVITDATPSIVVVDLDPSRRIWGGVPRAPQSNHSISWWRWIMFQIPWGQITTTVISLLLLNTHQYNYSKLTWMWPWEMAYWYLSMTVWQTINWKHDRQRTVAVHIKSHMTYIVI